MIDKRLFSTAFTQSKAVPDTDLRILRYFTRVRQYWPLDAGQHQLFDMGKPLELRISTSPYLALSNFQGQDGFANSGEKKTETCTWSARPNPDLWPCVPTALLVEFCSLVWDCTVRLFTHEGVSSLQRQTLKTSSRPLLLFPQCKWPHWRRDFYCTLSSAELHERTHTPAIQM